MGMLLQVEVRLEGEGEKTAGDGKLQGAHFSRYTLQSMEVFFKLFILIKK